MNAFHALLTGLTLGTLSLVPGVKAQVVTVKVKGKKATDAAQPAKTMTPVQLMETLGGKSESVDLPTDARLEASGGVFI